METQKAIQNSTPTEPLELTRAARTLGLVEVRAWVEESVAPSSSSERSKRCRARAEEMGWRQLSVTAPIDLHPALKEIASRTKSGEPLVDVLECLLANLKPVTPQPANPSKPPSPTGRTWLTLAVAAVRAYMRRLESWLSSKSDIKPSA